MKIIVSISLLILVTTSCTNKWMGSRWPASDIADDASCQELMIKLTRIPEELDYHPSRQKTHFWQFSPRELLQHLFGNPSDRLYRKIGPDYQTMFKDKAVVNLTNYNLSRREIKHLSDFISWNKIKTLDLSKNLLLSENEVVEIIAKTPNLEEINLLLTATGKSHKIVEALTANTKLKSITVNNISYNDLLKLCNEHPKLKTVDLRNTDFSGRQLLAFIQSGSADNIKRLTIPKLKTNHSENLLDTTAKDMGIRVKKLLSIEAVYDEMNPRSVYDGDTIKLDLPLDYIGNDMEIRLVGIDTAEMRTDSEFEKKVALAAKHFVSQMLQNGKKIEVRNAHKGKYFRFVGDVYVDGVSISDEILAKNLGVRYDGNTKTIVNWEDFYYAHQEIIDYWNQSQFWD